MENVSDHPVALGPVMAVSVSTRRTLKDSPLPVKSMSERGRVVSQRHMNHLDGSGDIWNWNIQAPTTVRAPVTPPREYFVLILGRLEELGRGRCERRERWMTRSKSHGSKVVISAVRSGAVNPVSRTALCSPGVRIPTLKREPITWKERCSGRLRAGIAPGSHSSLQRLKVGPMPGVSQASELTQDPVARSYIRCCIPLFPGVFKSIFPFLHIVNFAYPRPAATATQDGFRCAAELLRAVPP